MKQLQEILERNQKMDPEKIKNRLLVFLLTVFVLEAILSSIGNFKLNEYSRLENEKIKKIQTILDNAPILAKAISVYDIDQNKIIYGKNDQTAIPIASLAKTMTVVTALNKHGADSVVSISSNAIKQSGDDGFFINERWKIGDLARLTLIGSLNDGAYLLTENISDFLETMNNKARKIGMQNVLFLNPTGLDIDENEPGLSATLRVAMRAGAYSSAYDANILAIYALKDYPAIFSSTVLSEINLKSESGFNHEIKNTNIILAKIPNLLFSKTGFTELAGGSLTVIFKNQEGKKIAITILGSTLEGRFSDMEKIVDVLH